MRSQRFGVEIEMTGLTRAKAAAVIAGHFNTAATHIGGAYDKYSVRDCEGRAWNIVYDSSIDADSSPPIRQGEEYPYRVEVVTPICRYDDIETIQEIIRELRHRGAMVNESCGIHIHVDATPHTPQSLRNISNIIAAKEDILYRALDVDVRAEYYCQKTDLRFLDDLNRRRPKTMSELERIWYNGESRRDKHYDKSRYHGLNLHSVFSKGTIEFRLFNSTLHAGKVKAYIQLCLAISHQALTQKRASHTRTQSSNEKYTFRTWLLHLGLIGDEFKTARLHLLANLDGNIAWKDPSQAHKHNKEREEVDSRYDSVADRTENEITNNEETDDAESPVFSM